MVSSEGALPTQKYATNPIKKPEDMFTTSYFFILKMSRIAVKDARGIAIFILPTIGINTPVKFQIAMESRMPSKNVVVNLKMSVVSFTSKRNVVKSR